MVTREAGPLTTAIHASVQRDFAPARKLGLTLVRTRGARRSPETPMRFGLIIAKQHPPGVSMVERFREHIDQVRAARDAGFDLVVMGQHYLSTPFQEVQTLPSLARLAAEAGTMRVGATVLLLPGCGPTARTSDAASLAQAHLFCFDAFISRVESHWVVDLRMPQLQVNFYLAEPLISDTRNRNAAIRIHGSVERTIPLLRAPLCLLHAHSARSVNASCTDNAPAQRRAERVR